MNHYTLNTGHVRQSPRAEVGDEAIAICTPLLEPGEHAVPGQAGYRLVVPECQHGWAGTVYAGQRPLVSIGVADSAESAQEIWRELEQLYLRITDQGILASVDWQAPRQPALPWCANVIITPDVAMYWLGDFERCLAWAWLEGRR